MTLTNLIDDEESLLILQTEDMNEHADDNLLANEH